MPNETPTRGTLTKTCGECGRRYEVDIGYIPIVHWHNHFLCSPGCCAVRREKVAEREKPRFYENGDDYA